MIQSIRLRMLPFAIAALLVAANAPAQNITTSGINGRVLDAAGQPVAGAVVTIVHRPSGTTKEVTTDADGRYSAQGLRVGGPFDVKADKNNAKVAEQDEVYLQLGEAASINLAAASAQANLETVVVNAGAYQVFGADNKGASTTISQRQLQAIPMGNRSIDDVVRLDPRISIMDQAVGSISANGQNNRFNNTAVDGVSQGDPFGLNGNGLPYQKTPISPETIAEYNISTVNYDVISDTVGADVNAVTKSGTNDFHGSVYYAYRDADNLVGKAGWLPKSSASYDYKNYKQDWTGGFNIGGPIIKDTLFFFLSAERERTTGIGADSVNGLDPSLGNGPSSGTKVSPGDLQKVIDDAKALGLIPGTFGGAVPGLTYEDKRYLGKVDWNISDRHRASFTYQNTREELPSVAGNAVNTVGLSSYTYTKFISTNNSVVHLYDDWTDNFTTEAKFGYQHYVQNTVAPYHEPQVQVFMNPDGTGPQVFLGDEQFRHYNQIDTKTSTMFLAGTWTVGDHAIKGGFDYLENKIYNLFGRGEFGVYTFWGLDNFAQGKYATYNLFHPAPGYQLGDIAAVWTYNQLSPFLQDTWQVTNNLSLQYGFRWDIPGADGKPVYNQAFKDAFGYRNDNKIGSHNGVFEPRFSFNYNFDTSYKTQLRGGIGVFQSLSPAVWLTNPYQNNGVTLYSYRSTDPSAVPFSPDPLNQHTPSSIAVRAVDTVDKNFQLPTSLKTSLAFDRELPWWGLVGTAEYEHLDTIKGIRYEAIDFGAPTGVLPDGRQQFWKTPGEAPKSSDTLANRNKNFDPTSTLLTNTRKGGSDSLVLALAKPFTSELSGNVSVTLAHATDSDPGVDTIAFNGYQRVVRTNPNEDVESTSNYNIARTFKTSLIWQHAFFGDYKSTISSFYAGHDGLPYSFIFGNDANGDNLSGYDPAYIPTANDPKVAFKDGTDPKVIAQFQDFLAKNPYLSSHRGQIAGRNATHEPWVNQLDMSFAQEVPGLWGKGELRFDVFNVLNLLNKKWGEVQTLSPLAYARTRTLANYAGVNANGQYVYSLPTDKNGNYAPQQYIYYDGGFFDPTRTVSRWSVMVTLRYKF